MIGRPVEITFEFDYARNFTAMHLHTNNLFTKDVQVGNYPTLDRVGRILPRWRRDEKSQSKILGEKF